jgi:ATP-dependent protease ClpP protease subunit
MRENSARSIFVTGEINQSMVDRLTPEIVKLRNESIDPVTVYIDSLGGSTFHARLILNLLTGPNQDGKRGRIVTVVTGMAASSAADILAAGDYSIAYRHATIHYHGVRTSLGDITHESASSLVEILKQSNEGYALELANRVKRRFFFVYTQLASEFRKNEADCAQKSDVECLTEAMSNKLGAGAKILDLALTKLQRINSLLEAYGKHLEEHQQEFSRPADKEAFLLKFLVDWELKENDSTSWRFGPKGLTAIREDFVLLSDFEDGQHMRDLESEMKEWGQFLLDDKQRKEYEKLQGEDALEYLKAHKQESFRAIWHFLVSVCRALQQGENRLPPTDAYWLGLVDEIPGSGLANLREMIESFATVEKPTAPVVKMPDRSNRPGKVHTLVAGESELRWPKSTSKKNTAGKPPKKRARKSKK